MVLAYKPLIPNVEHSVCSTCWGLYVPGVSTSQDTLAAYMVLNWSGGWFSFLKGELPLRLRTGASQGFLCPSVLASLKAKAEEPHKPFFPFKISYSFMQLTQTTLLGTPVPTQGCLHHHQTKASRESIQTLKYKNLSKAATKGLYVKRKRNYIYCHLSVHMLLYQILKWQPTLHT